MGKDIRVRQGALWEVLEPFRYEMGRSRYTRTGQWNRRSERVCEKWRLERVKKYFRGKNVDQCPVPSW